jgi:hypothetical protein
MTPNTSTRGCVSPARCVCVCVCVRERERERERELLAPPSSVSLSTFPALLPSYNSLSTSPSPLPLHLSLLFLSAAHHYQVDELNFRNPSLPPLLFPLTPSQLLSKINEKTHSSLSASLSLFLSLSLSFSLLRSCSSASTRWACRPVQSSSTLSRRSAYIRYICIVYYICIYAGKYTIPGHHLAAVRRERERERERERTIHFTISRFFCDCNRLRTCCRFSLPLQHLYLL